MLICFLKPSEWLKSITEIAVAFTQTRTTMNQALIEELESTLRQAQLDGDVETLDRLIDDELLFVGPDGSLTSKSDDLALHQSGDVRFTAHEPLDMQWRIVSADVVVVALHARLAVLVHGQNFAGEYRYTRVWTRRANVWRVIAGHVSSVQTLPNA